MPLKSGRGESTHRYSSLSSSLRGSVTRTGPGPRPRFTGLPFATSPCSRAKYLAGSSSSEAHQCTAESRIYSHEVRIFPDALAGIRISRVHLLIHCTGSCTVHHGYHV